MLEKEFLKYLLDSGDNVSIALNLNFKAVYLDYETVGFSAKRELFKAITGFYNKYRKIITVGELEPFLRSLKVNEASLPAVLLMFEEVRMVQTTKSFEFIIDELKDHFATDILHKRLTASADSLIQNDLTKAIDAIKQGVYLSEAVLIRESSEGSIQDSFEESIKAYKDTKHGLIKPGLATGFPTIDKLAGGLKPGELDVVLAGSSEGKSTFMLNIAHHVQTKLNKNVLFVSLELPKSQILRRYNSLDACLTCNKLRDGNLSPEEEELFKASLIRSKNRLAKFYIVDQPLCTAQHVHAKVSELSSQFNVDLIVVDYLGLMQSSRPTDQGWQDIGNIALELRRTARFFKVPVLTAMQVNKESRKSKSAHYEQTDAALSGLVTFHADTVITLKTANPEVLKTGTGDCELNAFLSKCRDGNRGTFTVDAAFERMCMVERTYGV